MATPYVTTIRYEVDSTQDLAVAEYANQGKPALVIAAVQSQGRGRSGNVWWQAPRAVAASLAFGEETLAADDSLPLAVGIAIWGALVEEAGVEVGLKWPNDITVDDRKVGGILVERNEQRTVVGCGLNLWWPQPPETVGALFADDPGERIGERISRSWVDHLLATRAAWDRDAYKALCVTLGERVTWEPEGSGIARDIDATGGLVVETPAGEITLRSGTVRTVRPTD